MNGIDGLRELRRTLREALNQALSEARDRAGLSTDDIEVVVMAVVYAFAVLWLVHVWRTRHRVHRQRQLARGLAFMDGVVALLRVVMLLVVGVLLALARAASRSHYYRW